MNTCPVIGCIRSIRDTDVCCRSHWRQVPEALRAEIWRLYRAEPGSDAHRGAVLEALRLLNERVLEDQSCQS